jgi:hypothetical protein
VSHGKAIATPLVVYDIGYTIIFLFIVLGTSSVIFSQRDLK